jgi:hypothetical protein
VKSRGGYLRLDSYFPVALFVLPGAADEPLPTAVLPGPVAAPSLARLGALLMVSELEPLLPEPELYVSVEPPWPGPHPTSPTVAQAQRITSAFLIVGLILLSLTFSLIPSTLSRVDVNLVLPAGETTS